MTTIYVDGDACPVKPEIYRVAKRHTLRVVVVLNGFVQAPPLSLVEIVTVRGHLDAADDWIAERAAFPDVVVTADMPLAERVVKRGARALTPRGKELDEAAVADAVATRNLLAQLREADMVKGGPPPFDAKDRSRFLGALENVLQSVARERSRKGVDSART